MANARRSSKKNKVWQGRGNPNLNALISERAYRIFEEKGYTHGHDLDDWLEAERQVLTEIKRRSRVL